MLYPRGRTGLPLVVAAVTIYYVNLLLEYKRLYSTPDAILALTPLGGGKFQHHKHRFSRESSISAKLRSHVQYWNTQPEGLRYHVADVTSPRSRTCQCYARWLNETSEDVCRDIKNEAVHHGKPQVQLAIPDGWYSNVLCAQEHTQGILDCPASLCHFELVSTEDPYANYSQFDGLLHYSGSYMPVYPGKSVGNPWFKLGFIWEEPPIDYSTAAHYFDRGYDVAFTYRLPDGMPKALFFQTSLLELPVEFFTDFQPPTWKSRNLNVASIISHCVPERESIIKALSQYMKVDRFGTCGDGTRGGELHPECQDGPWWIRQRCLIGHYRFYLAFENSRSESYVTEKLWQPLLMGAIPIYWGAPNVNDFLPHPNAIIRVSDFESIEGLANYLQFLTTSDTAYQRHMEWRYKALPQSFLDLFQTSPGHAPCHLCDLIASEKALHDVSGLS